MAQYNPKSLKAGEFINHEEILETLRYAEENKNNVELIDKPAGKGTAQEERERCPLRRADAP